MIDIETLDVCRKAIVLQVGLVIWNTNPESDESTEVLYAKNFNLEIDSQIEEKRTMQFSTLKFWMEQSDAARDSVMTNDAQSGYGDEIPPTSRWMPGMFFTALKRLEQTYSPARWYAKGSFDFNILESLAEDFRWKGELPWNFRTKRDLRSVLDFSYDAKNLKRDDVAHTGMDDARHQIRQLMMVRKAITK